MAKKNSPVAPADDWQVESDLRTMVDCKAIEADPKRLAKVQALAKQKMMAHASIATKGAAPAAK
jgi:hypothetical protein